MAENLTNEKLVKRFPSQFDLVNYAIQRAKVKIETGHIHTQNSAMEVISDILDHKDNYETIYKDARPEAIIEEHIEHVARFEKPAKSSEKTRNRRILVD